MNYKVGDKIKIKTWEEMEQSLGTIDDIHWTANNPPTIKCECGFDGNMENIINYASVA